MKQKKLLYTGKAKSVYRTDVKGKLIVEFRDDITAFDGGKKDTLKNKGSYNAGVSAFFFDYLEKNGVKTHFLEMLDERRMVVRELSMIPLEVIVRNIAAGSIVRNYPFKEGTLKTAGDRDRLQGRLPARPDAQRRPDRGAENCNTGRTQKDQEDRAQDQHPPLQPDGKAGDHPRGLQMEFGRQGKTIYLGDEISMDSMRLWDKKTGESLDKDVYRFNKGDVMATYNRVAARITKKPKAGVAKKKAAAPKKKVVKRTR